MDELVFWLTVKKFPKIGDITLISLLKEYGNIEEIFKNFKSENFNKEKALKESEAEIEKCKKLNIKILTYNQKEYPQKLKEIHSPPTILYYRGDIELLKRENIVAIVGSRNPTEYGINATKDIVKDLLKYNIIVVSGFAAGIDSIAHLTTLDNNGKTIAVLGSGINIIYPAKNRFLFQKILNNGLIISEFPLNTKPEPGNFPKRNRIISGISKAVVVMEASLKSGSLITAEFALNQGKDIYALPGNIYNYKAKGTNYLIKNGAYLIENSRDIIENSFSNLLTSSNKKTDNSKLKLSSKIEEKIYNLLLKESLTFDELVLNLKLPPYEIMPYVSSMEINGIVKSINGKLHIINYLD